MRCPPACPSRPRHPLLEGAAAKVGFHQSAFGVPHRAAGIRILYSLVTREAFEPAILFSFQYRGLEATWGL